MFQFQIDVYTHSIRVTRFDTRGKDALLDYCRKLAQYGLVKVGFNRFAKQMLRVYVGVKNDRSEFRFHRNQLDDLLGHLEYHGYMSYGINVVEHKAYTPVKAVMGMDPKWQARDYQIPIIDYLIAPGAIKVVTLQTGKGKTFTALKAADAIGERTFLTIKGMFIPKWIEDVKGAYDIKKGDLIVVRGSKALRDLLEVAEAGELTAKFIICSNKTIYNYLQSYERSGDDFFTYPVEPGRLFEVLGVGLSLGDEVHGDFHLKFRQLVYTHVPKTIELSATLEADDPFMNTVYNIAFPMGLRYQGAVYDRYIAVTALTYMLMPSTRGKLKYKQKGRKSYSHVQFETSIMKHRDLLETYLRMIAYVTDHTFINKFEDGQRMLIFASTVEMCAIIAQYLQRRYTTLRVSRYVSEDEYDVLLESDISVSTVKSAGTAVDIENLRTCLLTDALGSKQANIQALGRLRRLKNYPKVTPEFYYFVCTDIEKHVEYHNRKRESFSDKALSFNTVPLEFKL